jgi:peptidoglycan/xylan/chitin deacetylase (PgdA/CDA1 family)
MSRARTPFLLLLVLTSLTRCATSTSPETTGHLKPEIAAKAQQDLQESSKLPPPPAQRPVGAEVVSHGDRSQKKIALTFDACSTRDVSQYDEPVTRVLEETRTPATIFLGGSWAKEEAAHVKALAANPLIELGNHTYTHPHLTRIHDEKRIREELVRTQAQVMALAGVLPRFFRPPYGEYDQRVVQIAASVGLTTIEYDLASGDPDQHATKERLVEWVLRQAQPGSIVVMHINHLRFHTAEALPDIIRGLRARGYELVTVGELLRSSHGDELAASTSPTR